MSTFGPSVGSAVGPTATLMPHWTPTRLPLSDGWQLDLPSHWQSHADTAFERQWWNQYQGTVLSLVRQGFQPWLSPQVLAAMPVWVAVFPQEKVVRLYTVQARQEMFWRDCLQSVGLWDEDAPLALHLHALDQLDLTRSPSVWQQVSARYDLPSLANGPELGSWFNQLKPHLSSYKPSVLERAMNWALDQMTAYPDLRGPMLRFVALLPSLDYDKGGDVLKEAALEVLATIQAAVKHHPQCLPAGLRVWLTTAAPLAVAMPAPLMAQWVRAKVRWSARRFIVGETLAEAMPAVQKLAATHRQVTVDPLGEVVLSAKEADAYETRVLAIIEQLGKQFNPNHQIARNPAKLPLAHLSLKVSALGTNLRAEAVEAARETVVPRLRRVLLAAKAHGVFINVDAEHYVLRDLIFDLWRDTLLSTPELADWPDTGIVVQAYLRDAWPHFQAVLALAKQRGVPMCVRLVKGAYWDIETLEAQAHGYSAPQFLNKEESDLHFRQLIHGILAEGEHLQLAVGGHNLADHCYAEALRAERFNNAPVIEHQCLHQTFEALSLAMARAGWIVRDYVPVGNLLVGMAYLVRRILENASQIGVLAAARKSHTVLPDDPMAIHQEKVAQGLLNLQPIDWLREGAFANVAPLRPDQPAEKAAIDAALAAFEPATPHATVAPLYGEWHTSCNPSHPQEAIGQIRFATADDTQLAVEILHRTFVMGGWDGWPVSHRALVLAKVADLLLLRRPAFTALIVKESGKKIVEALADVDEAIDFLNFYAREAVSLSQHYPQVVARGVTAVIAPWNFPLAIPCGMVAAALAMGNPVALKSAQQTPLIADALVQLLHEAGVPTSALIHLPGDGETVGKTLANHPNVATVAFTGSRAVGLSLLKTAGARTVQHPKTGLYLPVQVIAEMGGKNAIIVTADADLDDAVAGIVASVCSHAGQKCSAASRVLVDERIAKTLAKRLTRALAEWRVGPAEDWNTQINPVITAHDRARLQQAAASARQEVSQFGGTVWLDQSPVEGHGHFVSPMLVELPPRRALFSESMAQQELFGPVVHLIPFHTLEEAIQIANAVPYALTGGVYSQSPQKVQWVLDRLAAGNLYANRSITGARVGVEPFGGFRQSGTGPKAGDIEYLKAFVTVPGVEYPFQVQTATPVSAMHGAIAPLLKTDGTAAPLSTASDREIVLAGLHQWILAHEDEATIATPLTRLHLWLQGEGEQLLVHGRDNRHVPGQRSFNRYTRPVGNVLIVAEQATVSQWLVPQIWMAFWLGCAVTVVTVSEEAQASWHVWQQSLEAVVPQVARRRWQLDSLPLTQVKSVIEGGTWPVVLVDGAPDMVGYCQEWVAAGQGKHVSLSVVLSAASQGIAGDWVGLLHRYCHPASWAINLVRHGAVLTSGDKD